MDVTFGLHTGPSNTTVDELRSLWRRAEDGPFDWISIWDHLYGADGVSVTNLEAVALQTALALTTTRVRVGSLVYCAAFRHPAVLAKAATTIDHLSGGRCEVGIGAGWARYEYEAFGVEWLPRGPRLDLLEESVRCLRGLLHAGPGEPFDFDGHHVRMAGAVNEPRPLQERLPIWVGGGGERRTLRIVARHADGWNVPFVSPEVFAHKNRVLDEHCAAEGRDPAEVRRSVNVGAATDEASLQRQMGTLAEGARGGVLVGGRAAIVDGLGRYVEAGAQQVNLAVRAPFEHGIVDLVAEAIEELR